MGCRSNAVRLMTLSTSAVAVCCCSDSRSSLSSRVFSIAMTAWRGKVRDQLDLLVGERAHLLAVDDDAADELPVFEHGHQQHGANAGSSQQDQARVHSERSPTLDRDIGDVDDLPGRGEARKRHVRALGSSNRAGLPPRLNKGRRACYARRPRGRARRRDRNRLPKLASQIRTAFASMAWNTGSSSPGELR